MPSENENTEEDWAQVAEDFMFAAEHAHEIIEAYFERRKVEATHIEEYFYWTRSALEMAGCDAGDIKEAIQQWKDGL